jgi:hypothetical protein
VMVATHLLVLKLGHLVVVGVSPRFCRIGYRDLQVLHGPATASASMWSRGRCHSTVGRVALSGHRQAPMSRSLARSLRSSLAAMAAERRGSPKGVDFYVTAGGRFGTWRHWEDMRRYGFVSAGHGSRYRKAMSNLFVGARVRAAIPVAVGVARSHAGAGHGYVGVGEVTAPAVRVRDFEVEIDGAAVPILSAPLRATAMGDRADDAELSEYVARVRWIDARRQEAAFWARSATHSRCSGCVRRFGTTMRSRPGVARFVRDPTSVVPLRRLGFWCWLLGLSDMPT